MPRPHPGGTTYAPTHLQAPRFGPGSLSPRSAPSRASSAPVRVCLAHGDGQFHVRILACVCRMYAACLPQDTQISSLQPASLVGRMIFKPVSPHGYTKSGLQAGSSLHALLARGLPWLEPSACRKSVADIPKGRSATPVASSHSSPATGASEYRGCRRRWHARRRAWTVCSDSPWAPGAVLG